MADEQAIQTQPVAEIPEREKLAAAIDAEKKARSKRVMTQIEQLCKDNNCQFIARPTLVEQPTGGFVITANPGVIAL